MSYFIPWTCLLICFSFSLRVHIIKRPRIFPLSISIDKSMYHSKLSDFLVSPSSIIKLSPSEFIVWLYLNALRLLFTSHQLKMKPVCLYFKCSSGLCKGGLSVCPLRALPSSLAEADKGCSFICHGAAFCSQELDSVSGKGCNTHPSPWLT